MDRTAARFALVEHVRAAHDGRATAARAATAVAALGADAELRADYELADACEAAARVLATGEAPVVVCTEIAEVAAPDPDAVPGWAQSDAESLRVLTLADARRTAAAEAAAIHGA